MANGKREDKAEGTVFSRIPKEGGVEALGVEKSEDGTKAWRRRGLRVAESDVYDLMRVSLGIVGAFRALDCQGPGGGESDGLSLGQGDLGEVGQVGVLGPGVAVDAGSDEARRGTEEERDGGRGEKPSTPGGSCAEGLGRPALTPPIVDEGWGARVEEELHVRMIRAGGLLTLLGAGDDGREGHVAIIACAFTGGGGVGAFACRRDGDGSRGGGWAVVVDARAEFCAEGGRVGIVVVGVVSRDVRGRQRGTVGEVCVAVGEVCATDAGEGACPRGGEVDGVDPGRNVCDLRDIPFGDRWIGCEGVFGEDGSGRLVVLRGALWDQGLDEGCQVVAGKGGRDNVKKTLEVTRQGAPVGVAEASVLLRRAVHNGVEADRDPLGDLGEPRKASVDDVEEDLFGGSSLDQVASRDGLKEDRGGAEDIRACIDIFGAGLLRGHVADFPHEHSRAGTACPIRGLGDAEVRDLDLAVA